MPDIRETRETRVDYDADGRPIGSRTLVEEPRKRGGFGWGMLFGVTILAVAVIAFAYTQGSFQSAGVEADRATAEAERSLDEASAAATEAWRDTQDAMRNETAAPRTETNPNDAVVRDPETPMSDPASN